DLERDDGERLWLPATTDRPPPGHRPSAGLSFLGHVEAAELDRLFAGAVCVVAPAFREDYGLTAIEAMAYGKPVVVCRDGGGLVDTVVDDVNGLVVEPSGAGIAAAVRRLRDEPGLAARLSQGALETAATYTWDRAMAQFSDALERVAA
nr:glycosyltransferase family 4 protein [Acidimicrobiia bacterium]